MPFYQLDDVVPNATVPAVYLCMHYHVFDEKHLQIGPFTAVILLRNPLDVCQSSVRYHKTSKESWLHVPRYDNQTYQQFILSMGDYTAMLFELTCGICSHTLTTMLSTIRYFEKKQFSSVVKVMLLEDFKFDMNKASREMGLFLGVKNMKIWLNSAKSASYTKFTKKKHSTIRENPEAQAKAMSSRFEFRGSLNCLHYQQFDRKYGTDFLREVHYDDAIPIFEMERNKSCVEEGYSAYQTAVYPIEDCKCGKKLTSFKGCSLGSTGKK